MECAVGIGTQWGWHGRKTTKLKCTGVKDRMTKGCHELKNNYGENKRKKKNGRCGRNKTTSLKTTVNKYIQYKY